MLVESALFCHTRRTDAVLPTPAPALTNNAVECEVAKPIPTPIPEDVKARFWAKVDVRGPDECWEWQSALNNKGYGLFYMGRSHAAHRVSYVIAGRYIPQGFFICHACDNPPCVNPSHLFAGTHMDNMHDCVSKNRMHPGPVKWNLEDLEELLTLNLTIREMGVRLGIHETTLLRYLQKYRGHPRKEPA